MLAFIGNAEIVEDVHVEDLSCELELANEDEGFYLEETAWGLEFGQLSVEFLEVFYR